MQKITVTDGPILSIVESVAGALDGKEDHLLSLTNAGKAVLFDGTSPAIAVMVGKLQPGSTVVQARLIGKGGTVRVIQDEQIAIGQPVRGKPTTARVELADAAGANRVLGYKIGPNAGAQGDVIEIVDLVEVRRIPSADTITAAADLAAVKAAVLTILQAQGLVAS